MHAYVCICAHTSYDSMHIIYVQRTPNYPKHSYYYLIKANMSPKHSYYYLIKANISVFGEYATKSTKSARVLGSNQCVSCKRDMF